MLVCWQIACPTKGGKGDNRMANMGILGKQRKVKELRAVRNSLSDAGAKAQVQSAIERMERSIGRAAAKVGRKPSMRKTGLHAVGPNVAQKQVS